MLVTIIIPCYNEKNTIEQIINKILNIKGIDKQIILVDDCSNDGTKEILLNKIESKVDKIIYHDFNKGKGSAIKSSIQFIKGEIVIIQDADLEYDPSDYINLLKPFINKEVNVVYGSRVLGRLKKEKGFSKNFRIFGNYILTKFSNIINNQNLTDAHTCYKLFRREIFLKLDLRENDFSFCPEVTTKLSKLNEKITEVPINYYGREYKEGKKIGYKDAIKAILVIFKYKFKKFSD
tara:strand:- start:2531 stop:3235 length:705 start_codon:yes stop_codon:yes gene_type:complete